MRLMIVTIGLSLLTCFAHADGKKIVKWVDSHGVTHYGDKIPASEAGRSNSEMNSQGVVVKRNEVKPQTPDITKQQNTEQARKDAILLASYTKAEEIDLAKERNLQMDQASLQALTQQRETVNARNLRNAETAAKITKRGKPVPAYLTDELKLSKAELGRIDKQIADRNLSIEATKKRFAEEKARFVALKQPSAGQAGIGNETVQTQQITETAPTKTQDITEPAKASNNKSPSAIPQKNQATKSK